MLAYYFLSMQMKRSEREDSAYNHYKFIHVMKRRSKLDVVVLTNCPSNDFSY